jgi:ribosomal-protein-alanine N-acetyltransferase
MPGAAFIEGDKVNLRTIEEEDLEFIRDSFNQPEVWKNLDYKIPQNLKQEREFFEEVISSEDSVNLAICSDNQLMGLIELKEQENGDGVAEIGIWIAPDYHGNGYGTEASKLLVDHAFKELRYHKVYARAFESNKASQTVWKKLGFEKEGELREQAYRKGSYEDTYIYGVLEDEWSS